MYALVIVLPTQAINADLSADDSIVELFPIKNDHWPLFTFAFPIANRPLLLIEGPKQNPPQFSSEFDPIATHEPALASAELPIARDWLAIALDHCPKAYDQNGACALHPLPIAIV